jgi:hypothetical protein
MSDTKDITARAAVASLRSVASNVAEDLETFAAIMINIGHSVPNDMVQPDWFSWFGRQLERVSVELYAELKEGAL